jgi:hypothetical protein
LHRQPPSQGSFHSLILILLVNVCSWFTAGVTLPGPTVCRQRAGDVNGIGALYETRFWDPHCLGRLRRQWPAPIMELPAYAIGCMTAFWFVERVGSVLNGAT